jgi:hypothetical protein
MEIAIAEERALVFQEKLTIDQAEGRAWGHKLAAFGSMVKMTSFIRKPKDSEFELIYKEHRFQPFWHIECSARYVYERNREYPISLSGKEIEAVTIQENKYHASDCRIVLQAVEHCREEPQREVFVDGITGEENPALIDYLEYPANEMSIEDIDNLPDKGIIIVPPQSRATAIVRDVLLGVMKSLQADRILEDHVEIQRVDLYYRPVYAFQYRWASKEKEAIVEMDALTGTLESDGTVYRQYMGQILDADFLFDVGIDTVDLLVPGGGIAIKLARKGIDLARSRSQ